MPDPSAPRRPRSVVFTDDDWARLLDLARMNRTTRSSLIRRAVKILVTDQVDADRDDAMRGGRLPRHDSRCLVCRVSEIPDPVPPTTATLRQNLRSQT